MLAFQGKGREHELGKGIVQQAHMDGDEIMFEYVGYDDVHR